MREPTVIPLDVLKEHLQYSPETGLFTWLKSTTRSIRIGDIAGHRGGNPPPRKKTICISIGGTRVAAHRLAWLYMTGELPSQMVLHKDGNQHNKKWSNLSAGTRPDAMLRSKTIRQANTTGARGVFAEKRTGRYYAQGRFEGVTECLGSYDTIGEAEAAIKAFDNKHKSF